MATKSQFSVNQRYRSRDTSFFTLYINGFLAQEASLAKPHPHTLYVVIGGCWVLLAIMFLRHRNQNANLVLDGSKIFL